jgi:D-alanine-D-alanine ligase
MTRLANKTISDDMDTNAVQNRLKITVLSGGPSAEREVSLQSGRAVADALEKTGHEVHRADISPDSLEALDEPVDLVFIALHGSFGEDGQLQRILDERRIRYCGSGAESSAQAMDKVASKRLFIEAGLPTAPFDVVYPERVETVAARWLPPAVVKPVDQGSSVDCRIIRKREDLQSVLERMTRQYGRCMIEKFVDGYDVTVGMLGETPLPPIQVRTKREFYNYEAKYLDDQTEYLFNIDLPTSTLDNIQQLSVQAHRILGCRDFSRVDWIVDARTQQPYLLEVNTIPGMTDHSLLPKAAGRAGLSFEVLCQRIVELACQR